MSQGQGTVLLSAPRRQVFPLLCPRCADPMRIIAFVAKLGTVQRILEPLDEPTPRSASRPDIERLREDLFEAPCSSAPKTTLATVMGRTS